MSYLEAVPPGLVDGLEGTSTTGKALTAVFLTIALYNSLELAVLLGWTFRRYRGLYFWSLLASVLGLITYTVGSILHYFNFTPLSVGLPISYCGFIVLVPVQSLVLYSRLYLVIYNEEFLRALLYAIVIVAVVLIIPSSIATFGSAFIRQAPWNRAYHIIERLQVTGFCVQELIISLLYIWATVRLLRLSPEGQNRATRIMYELLGINFIIIALDIALVVMEYLNLYYLQVCLKALVYSVKLKLEFAVLGRLVALTKTPRGRQRDRPENSEFIGPTCISLDFTNAGKPDSQPKPSPVGEIGLLASPSQGISDNDLLADEREQKDGP